MSWLRSLTGFKKNVLFPSIITDIGKNCGCSVEIISLKTVNLIITAEYIVHHVFFYLSQKRDMCIVE